MSTSLSSLSCWGCWVAMIAFVAAPVSAASGPGCVRVAIAEPVELPDGTVYPAGNLSLCTGASLSPVTSLQRVSVGGMPVGILLSRSGESEGVPNAAPQVRFRRVASGHLLLVGYAWTSGTTNRTYLLRDPAEQHRAPRYDVSVTPAIAQAVEVPAPVLVARVD